MQDIHETDECIIGAVVNGHPDLILNTALEQVDRYLDLPKIVISPLRGKAPLMGIAAGIFGCFDTS